jgi:hypothetical protein
MLTKRMILSIFMKKYGSKLLINEEYFKTYTSSQMKPELEPQLTFVVVPL